jgi:hypothetical protein
MAEITEHYDNLAERQEKIAYWEGQGYRMLHDDFDDPHWKQGDPMVGTLTFTDEPAPIAQTEPTLSTHIVTLVSVDPTKARPARIKRVWEGRDYYYDGLATQTVKDEYVAGKIKVGDYLIVHFDDIGELVVTAKIFKSW